MPPFPKLRLRPDPNHPPPLRRGGPIAGADPTRPAAATSPSDVQQVVTNAGRPNGAGGSSAPPGGVTSPEDDVGDLARLQQEHDKERAAAQQQLAAGKAQALQTAAAKSGAAGFGLSGASAALQGDVGRASDRNAVLTMADLRGKQNDENYQELQREVALNDAEETDDVDYNGDHMIAGQPVGGKVGDRNPDNNGHAKDQTPTQLAASVAGIVKGTGGTGKPNDPWGGIGGMGEDKLLQLADTGLTFKNMRVEHGAINGETYIYCQGSDGAWYKFLVPTDNATTDGTAMSWFQSDAGGA